MPKVNRPCGDCSTVATGLAHRKRIRTSIRYPAKVFLRRNMSIENAKELITQVKDHNGCTSPYAAELLEQAIAALDEPVCKTCGDSGVVCDDEDLGGHAVTNNPCPDCQKPACGEPDESQSEFTKRCRNEYCCPCTEDEECGKDFEKALNIIDRLEKEKKQLADKIKKLEYCLSKMVSFYGGLADTVGFDEDARQAVDNARKALKEKE